MSAIHIPNLAISPAIPRLVIRPLHIIRLIIRHIVQALPACTLPDLDLRVHPVQQKRRVLTRHLCTFLSFAVPLVIKDFGVILDVNGGTTSTATGAVGGAAEVHFALHNVNVGFVAGAAQGVVVVVVIVVFRADDTAEVLGEVELETVVGALAGFGEAEGGAAGRVSRVFFERDRR